MNVQLAQVGAGVVAAATPWMVTRIARAVARGQLEGSERLGLENRAYRRLGPSTLLAGCVLGVMGVVLPAPSLWIALVGTAAFIALAPLGLRALQHLDRDTLTMRQVESGTRTASLAVRRHHDYLATSWRLVLYVSAMMGVALFAWRAALPSPVERRLLVPAACSLMALVFLWLYETWIRALVADPIIPDSPESRHARRRLIRRVFATESLLVAGFLGLAHALLDLDWTAAGWWPFITVVGGGVLGVFGCSLALSADLAAQRYRVVSDQPHRA